MKDLYYELTDDGYHIYDRNDSLYHIHQYEPYIPDHTKSYEENAQLQIHEFMVSDYASAIINEEITIQDVPTEYQEEVTKLVDEIKSRMEEIV